MARQPVLRSVRPALYPPALRRPVVVSLARSAERGNYPGRTQASRTLATPPSSNQSGSGDHEKPSAHPEGSNTLIILSSLGALGGLYYYYARGHPTGDREAARRQEEETRRKVKDMGESAAQRGQREYDQVKTSVGDAASAARAHASDAGTDWAERARRDVHEAQAQAGELKNTAERKLSDIRDRSEKKFEEEKDNVARHAREAENKSRGWFGWGSSK